MAQTTREQRTTAQIEEQKKRIDEIYREQRAEFDKIAKQIQEAKRKINEALKQLKGK